MYDVAIIGAGPAGATLARLVADSFKVLLLDKRRFDRPDGPGRAKCCGGLLAPDAQRALAQLELDLPREVLVGRQVFAVRAIDLAADLERIYARQYVNLDRGRFERHLLSLVPSAVDIRPGWRFKAACREGYWFRVACTAGGKEATEKARLLVAADGANSTVRKQLDGRRPWPRTYLAVQQWFDVGRGTPYFSAVFDPEITDYYSWAIPKDDRLIVGSALRPGRAPRRRFKLLTNKLRQRGFDLGRPVRREAAYLRRPTSLDQLCPLADGVALIGEAAGWVSPSSGEGISYALQSAAMLAASIREDPENFAPPYLARCRSLRANIRRKLLKCSLIYRPALRRAFMASGLGALDVESPELPLSGPSVESVGALLQR